MRCAHGPAAACAGLRPARPRLCRLCSSGRTLVLGMVIGDGYGDGRVWARPRSCLSAPGCDPRARVRTALRVPMGTGLWSGAGYPSAVAAEAN